MKTCKSMVSMYDGEWTGLCVRPAKHDGEHDYADTLGMCLVNEDCRASSELYVANTGVRNSPHPHNH